MIKFIVDRLHVGTPDAEVEAEIRKRVKRANRKKKGAITSQQADAYVKEALKIHHENRKLYVDVMSGQI